MPNAVTLMSEYCPDGRRATLTNAMFCGFPLGAAFGGFLAAAMPLAGAIASIAGACTGGGAAIAAACDLRVATADARLGFPIARTLGNCLSGDTLGLLIALLGRGRVVDMLLRARFIDADEALTAGFLGTVTDDVDATTAEWAATLKGHAPLTMWSVKEIVRRLSDLGGGIDDADVVERIYGSEDFHEAVRAFIAKEDYEWTGR